MKKAFVFGFVCGVAALAFGAKPIAKKTEELAAWSTKMADQAALARRESQMREFEE